MSVIILVINKIRLPHRGSPIIIINWRTASYIAILIQLMLSLIPFKIAKEWDIVQKLSWMWSFWVSLTGGMFTAGTCLSELNSRSQRLFSSEKKNYSSKLKNKKRIRKLWWKHNHAQWIDRELWNKSANTDSNSGRKRDATII